MFDKKLTVELTDESRKALVRVSEEVSALQALIADLAQNVADLITRVENEIIVHVDEATGQHGDGLQVFAVEDDPPTDVRPTQELPEVMQRPTGFDTSATDDADRIRNTPFTRTPRPVQVEWLLEVLQDGRWQCASELSRVFANDEKHKRYLRAVFTHRFREMHEEGLLERRDSRVKGSMYEYRIRREA